MRALAHRFQIFIGCAGWNLPGEQRTQFPETGTHLARYATRFSAVEVNSSFYRPHRRSTYTRWAATVPDAFRFAVKMPKAITHAARLCSIEEPLARFLDEVEGLENKLGCLLVQLPPSFTFDERVAADFFSLLREKTEVPVVFEPRHRTWFSPAAKAILDRSRIARVAADPPPVPQAAVVGGWRGFSYHRLHGSPRIYYSPYSDAFLGKLARHLIEEASAGIPVWCIFDNTALGASIANARSLRDALEMADA